MEPGTFYENLRKYYFYLQGHSASLNVFPDSESGLNFWTKTRKTFMETHPSIIQKLEIWKKLGKKKSK